MFIVYSTLAQVEFLASWFLKVNSKEYKRHKKLTPYNGSFKFAVFFMNNDECTDYARSKVLTRLPAFTKSRFKESSWAFQFWLKADVFG